MSRKIITRRLQFAYGHRVYGHESQCANIHGHNGVVFITATADELDSIGRIVDFSVIKDRFGTWLDQFWDHAFLWYAGDAVCEGLFRPVAYGYAPTQGMKNFRCEWNPTAENMSEFLLNIAPKLMHGTGVVITEIKLFETENCSAVTSVEEKLLVHTYPEGA